MDSNHFCLAMTDLDSAVKKDEDYYLQLTLKEYKFIFKKIIRHIIDDIGSSSDDSDEE